MYLDLLILFLVPHDAQVDSSMNTHLKQAGQLCRFEHHNSYASYATWQVKVTVRHKNPVSMAYLSIRGANIRYASCRKKYVLAKICVYNFYFAVCCIVLHFCLFE